MDQSRRKKYVSWQRGGCSQRSGEDFHETYSPVARTTSIRLLAALAAEMGLQIHQMDVITAYLNGKLEEDVYMEIPEQLREVLIKIIAGRHIGSNAKMIQKEEVMRTSARWLNAINEHQDSVCLLKKALYGLRQSGLQWYRRLATKLRQLGMQPTRRDPCMSRRKEHVMIIAIYVDDILLATNSSNWLKEIKQQLAESFEMKDLGPVSCCLGIEFQQDESNHSVILIQRQYTKMILERFGMQDCKPVKTPIDTNIQLTKPLQVNEKTMRLYPYQRLIGALMYLAIFTRPDIAFAVNFFNSSQFNTNYSDEHWLAVKRILRYLKGTIDYGLMYRRSDMPLYGVVDADWAANTVDRRSYSEYAFIVAGAAICWEARKQRTVALSSVEAEYMALSEATKEAIYFQDVLRDITGSYDCTVLFNDSQGAQRLICGSNIHHSRTKHIDLRHHFIQDCCASGVIELQ